MARAGELPLDGGAALGEGLPELATVHWRRRADEASLRRRDLAWTRSTLANVVPFLIVAAGLPLLAPVLGAVSVFALAFAWFIPDLYAARGAGVLRPPRGRRFDAAAEPRALGLLGDLVGHDARDVLADTGFVVEPGRLGTWLVGPAGALLARPGARRVQCWCVRATGDDLPPSDRIAHLLLALREDETGFATVANLSFSGAPWRVARKLSPAARRGLRAAIDIEGGTR